MEKSLYNERFSFANPLSTTAACRSTRHRAKKLKEDSSSALYQPSTELEANHDCVEEPAAVYEPNSQVMLEPQPSVVLPLPTASLACASNTSSDGFEWEDTYSCHPQSIEFLELLTDTLEVEEDEALSDTDITPDSAHSNDFTFDDPDAYAEPLYKDAVITTAASNVVIMKYAIKHNLTMDALADLLQLVKLHCPSPNNVPSSLYYFKKHFQELQYPVTYHYFCNACLMEISKNSEVCSNQECSAEIKSLSSFIELPVGLQLKTILSRKYVWHIVITYVTMCTPHNQIVNILVAKVGQF